MRNHAASTATLLSLLAACSDGGPDDDVDTLPACPEAGEVSVLATGFADGTEGIAVGDDGTVYVGASDRVVTIDPDGTVTTLAMVPGVVGLAWWSGAVWAASWEDDEGRQEPAVVEIKPDGTTTRTRIGNPAKPNFLLPSPWGSLLISDDFDTKIWEFTGNGVTTEWASGLASPNGMGFSPDRRTLWVANTFTNPAPLSKIPVTDGVAGAPETVFEWGTGAVPDGLVVAADGTVLVAINLGGRVDAWDGEAITPLATGVTYAASLAFDPEDPCTVIATSLLGPDVHRVAVGHRGP